ncbi:MAG: 4a-hydroxytetrahydrobiopterin dehydratase [Rhabdochlamydiaceae bacterium]|nr:4a-hydroxytetrahydrobiopterin dehydratase [Candidatus Amphrikana amoebophyrae]
MKKKCVPCKLGDAPMSSKELQSHLKELEQGWNIEKDHHLAKEYKFKNFKEALSFVSDIGQIADDEGHHPDLELGWGYVRVNLFTHKINGMTENDFILADKIDASHIARFGKPV